MFGEMAKLTEHMYHVDQTPVLALPSTVLLIRQKLFFFRNKWMTKTKENRLKHVHLVNGRQNRCITSAVDEGVQRLTWYTQVDDFQVFAGVGTRICATERCIIHNQRTDSLTFTSVNTYHVSSSATPFHRGVILF